MISSGFCNWFLSQFWGAVTTSSLKFIENSEFDDFLLFSGDPLWYLALGLVLQQKYTFWAKE